MYTRSAEQQRCNLDEELASKQRLVQEEQNKLKRMEELREKAREELVTLQRSSAEYQQQLDSLKNDVTSAQRDRLRMLRELEDKQLLLSKLQVEEQRHKEELAGRNIKFEAQRRALDEKIEAAERKLQDEKTRVDSWMTLWNEKRVGHFRLAGARLVGFRFSFYDNDASVCRLKHYVKWSETHN